MRTSGNPIKENNSKTPPYKRHRIIMPVFIPHQDDFYRDALQIFRICIDSLIATVSLEHVSITVIDNASIPEVGEYLLPLLNAGKIDQYLRNTVNRGKADAIIGHAKSCYEPFITISDADVLFLPGWLARIEKVYCAFPQAGVVCPFPAPNLRYLHCNSTWINHLGRLHGGKVVPDDTFDELEQTLGLPGFYTAAERRIQISLKPAIEQHQVLIGAGHFVACYRKCIFDRMYYTPKRQGLKSGLRDIEATVDRLGLSRLSIGENAVKHMGNLWEPWMLVPERDNRENCSISISDVPRMTFSRLLPSWLKVWIISPFYLLDKMKRRA
jgi:hypothetical protein